MRILTFICALLIAIPASADVGGVDFTFSQQGFYDAHYQSYLKRVETRRGLQLFINILVIRGVLDDMPVTSWERFQRELMKRKVYFPYPEKREPQRYYKQLFYLFGFDAPKSDSEEYALLNSHEYKIAKAKLALRYHSDRANPELSKFWWPVVDKTVKLMNIRRKNLEKKKIRMGYLSEHPILLDRPIREMMLLEARNNGKVLEDMRALKTVGSGFLASSIPILTAGDSD